MILCKTWWSSCKCRLDMRCCRKGLLILLKSVTSSLLYMTWMEQSWRLTGWNLATINAELGKWGWNQPFEKFAEKWSQGEGGQGEARVERQLQADVGWQGGRPSEKFLELAKTQLVENQKKLIQCKNYFTLFTKPSSLFPADSNFKHLWKVMRGQNCLMP